MKTRRARKQTGELSAPPRVTVRFRFYGEIRDVVGGPGTELAVPRGSSLREALAQLGSKYGESFTRRVLNRAGDLQPRWTRIYLDEEPMDTEESLDTRLEGPNPQVTVFVLSAIEGGALACRA